MNLLGKIRNVPDFPRPGIQFKDITTLLQDAEAFNHVIALLSERYKDAGLTAVVGIESRGFIFGAAMAYSLNLPFVPIRKLGKLPADTMSRSYELEYGSATIEIHRDALSTKDKVVLVDDLLATGGTLAAATHLIEETGASLHEVWVLIELGFLNGREKLGSVPVHAELVVND